MEENDSVEIGPAVQWIHPDDFPETAEFTISDFVTEETKWGKRAVFTLKDAKGDLWSINTWNLAMQKRQTLERTTLLNRRLKLSPLNEKKLLLTLI